jgi:hypothetical protein
MTRRGIQVSGSETEITEQLDRANLSTEDRAEIDTFRRYLRGDMSEMERYAYTVHDAPASDLAKVARTLEIAGGRGTVREARETAGLSIGQAMRLVPWDRARMEEIEATGIMSPEEHTALCSLYDVAGFVAESGKSGGKS